MSDNRNSKSGMKGDYKVVNVWIILNVISKSRQLPAIVLLKGVKYNCGNYFITVTRRHSSMVVSKTRQATS